ncbi:MAG: hypothetical protein H6812_10590 [Phycisphaeraceae bacterium]|nr:hypothetical protein [Phycisphaeraceae bacterium]
MPNRPISPGARTGITAIVRRRIEEGGERIWRLDDFSDLPPSAVAQALSRLERARFLERLSKGVYYRARNTTFGASKPNPAAVKELASKRTKVFPAGIAAANLLGLTTQVPRHSEVATSSMSLPRKLVGSETVVHTKRPESWERLTMMEAAILDVLRRGGRTSELPSSQTASKLKSLLKQRNRLARLLRVALTEPPRVRAMLGAFAELIGSSPQELKRLRDSLNPLSRFDFGLLGVLPNARAWQAKEFKPK